ncbi:MAG: Gfo/Idh/MocA family oxidoreductase [Hyphomicrobiaceae bacterium]|nr:Gfo/Idh/MocA family oxidoreductase [Hyphomicrobiaceae bacterium]
MTARVGIIGLGRMGARHVEAVGLAGGEVVAALDTAPEPFALGPFPKLAGVLVRSLDALVAARLDAVIISTTATTHAPLATAVIQAGVRRVVVEKPATANPADAVRLKAVADRVGARVVVNHGRRYSPNYQRIRTVLDGSEALGPLRAVVVTQGGGGLGCVGVHYLDLCNYLIGALPATVFARLTTPADINPRGAQFFDPGGSVMMLYPNGARGFVEIGDDVGVLGTIELRFARGFIRIADEMRPWTIQQRKAEVRERPMSAYGAPQEEVPFPDFVPHSAVDAARDVLLDALADGPTTCGIDVGLGIMQTLAAAHLSHAAGGPVPLPAKEAEMELDLRIP